MRTDWQNIKAGDVVVARNGQRFVIGQVITRDLPIDCDLHTKPCVIAASREPFNEDEFGMWYFLFDEGNHLTHLQTAFSGKYDRRTGAGINYYTGCTPSPFDVIGYYKGFVQQSLFN